VPDGIDALGAAFLPERTIKDPECRPVKVLNRFSKGRQATGV